MVTPEKLSYPSPSSILWAVVTASGRFDPVLLGQACITRDTIRNLPLFQDGGGDIKLEANTEIRAKFNKYIEGSTDSWMPVTSGPTTA